MAKTPNVPWWVINATSGNPPQYVITQVATQPQPANTAFTVTGPYQTKADAIAAVPAGQKYSVQAWNTLGGTLGAIGGVLGQIPIAGGITNPLQGIQAIGDFFQRLTQKATWVRVGEFAAGGLLLYVALKGIVTPAGVQPSNYSLGKAASKVVKFRKV